MNYKIVTIYFIRTSGGDSCGVDNDNSSDSDPFDLNTNQRIGIYSGIVFGSVSLVLTRTIFAFLICIAASRHLHNKMFRAILRVPVLFFDTNPVGKHIILHLKCSFIIAVLGRVLNRFSKDIGFMDDLLPYNFLELMSVSDSIAYMYNLHQFFLVADDEIYSYHDCGMYS